MSDRPWFGNWFLAIIGAAMIGVSLPAVLVSANNVLPKNLNHPGNFLTNHQDGDLKAPVTAREFVVGTLGLSLIALVGCGPLTILLGSLLFSYSRDEARGGRTLAEVIQTCLWLGVFLSMFNLPAWFVLNLIPAAGVELFIKALLLFGVAGSSAGAWIGWQAWRTEFPGTAWLPPFSLKALMLVVLSWGGLLAVFTGW